MENDHLGGLILVALLFGFAAVCIFGTIAAHSADHAVRVEAVEAGHADWIPLPNGKTEFQWKSLEGE